MRVAVSTRGGILFLNTPQKEAYMQRILEGEGFLADSFTPETTSFFDSERIDRIISAIVNDQKTGPILSEWAKHEHYLRCGHDLGTGCQCCAKISDEVSRWLGEDGEQDPHEVAAKRQIRRIAVGHAHHEAKKKAGSILKNFDMPYFPLCTECGGSGSFTYDGFELCPYCFH